MPFPEALRALNHRDFRFFWGGQLVSLIGTWMQSVAQSWLVLQLSGSPLKLGLIGTFQFAPVLMFSVVAGAIVDRLPKRRLILATQTLLALQAFTLTALVWTGHVRYWHVAVLALLLGCANVIDMPTRQAFIVEMVGRGDLVNAVALNSLVFNGARIVGPAVAGLLIARFGVAFAFLLNGLSFVAVLAALLATRTPGDPDPAGQLGIRAGVSGALAYAARTPPVAFTLTLIVAVSILVLNFNVVVPLIAKDVLGEGAHGFGLLMSSLGAGAVLAGIGLTLLRRGRPSLRFLAVSATVLSAGTASLGLVDHFASAAVLLVALGFCQILFSTGCNTTLQLTTPDALRGRVMGLYALANAGMTPFGSLLVGTMAEHLGVRAACMLGGGGGLVAVAVLVLVGRRAGLGWTLAREP